MNARETPDGFKALPRMQLLGLPVMSRVAIAIVILFATILQRTDWGRALFAVGGLYNLGRTGGVGGARTPVIVLVGLVTGVACGAFNGMLVVWLGLPSIVATIGTMSLFRGISFIVLGD